MRQYSENFNSAVQKVLVNEGGYVWDKVDAGGETNFGISKRAHPAEDIRNMTVDRAIEIYYTEYWMKGHYNEINNKALSAKVFDTAVNCGHRRAVKLLQKSLVAMGLDCVIDGLIGNQTIGMTNSENAGCILEQYKDEQFAFYEGLIRNKPAYAKYRNGWTRRAYS